MATLIEMATEMVVTRAKSTPLTAEEMIAELKFFHSELKRLETGEPVEENPVQAQPTAPSLTVKEAFRKNEVVCMVCGKGGFKTVTRHLATAHGMKPAEYRKQFQIPAGQSLSAKSYSESRRKMAQDRGLAGNLAKARETRMANIAAKKSPEKAGSPAPKGKGGRPKKAPAKAAQ